MRLTYLDFGKRFLDLTLAVIGFLVFLVPMLIVALLIWWTSGLPILFTQDRVGKDGKVFNLKKFRSMKTEQTNTSTLVTVSGDSRITSIGKNLRRWKLDELPQLWNVLVGEMSFVGPRPDVPSYADRLEGQDRLILILRPGITGPATLTYRNEEEILAQVDDPIRYYDDVIYPDKIRINLDYLQSCSFSKDIYYIYKTFLALPNLRGMISLQAKGFSHNNSKSK
jgi:lipopolysaccharide/colanic/teichoic acid biosynthesis glycosyltransferase